jgi:hypothetical protein
LLFIPLFNRADSEESSVIEIILAEKRVAGKPIDAARKSEFCNSHNICQKVA